jgi:hypothetical protein
LASVICGPRCNGRLCGRRVFDPRRPSYRLSGGRDDNLIVAHDRRGAIVRASHAKRQHAHRTAGRDVNKYGEFPISGRCGCRQRRAIQQDLNPPTGRCGACDKGRTIRLKPKDVDTGRGRDGRWRRFGLGQITRQNVGQTIA